MGSSNIGRSASRHNLTHVAIPGSPPILRSSIPGSPPFWDPEKQKVGPNCNFFAIGDCHIILNLKYRRKSAGNQSCDNSFPLYGSKKESPIEKKLQKYPNFCFCNGRTTETKQIRENYPTNAEWGLNAKLRGAAIQRPNAKLKGAAIHLGPAHPGRLPSST